ncbi:MAG: glutamine amidotransferase [Acidobacteriota bacterium]
MKTVVAVRHVHFEDLGSLEPVLAEFGFEIKYLDAGGGLPENYDWLKPDLLVLLGGPIGVHQEREYPFVATEVRAAEQRIKSQRLLLGICLGAQVMARALGSRVYPGPRKEIGWKPLSLTAACENTPVRHFGASSMFHWHGDTFDLPAGATLLASTDVCANQVYAWGERTLAFQCHPEFRAGQIDHWLIGHACELDAAGTDRQRLREDCASHGGKLEAASRAAFQDWLFRG